MIGTAVEMTAPLGERIAFQRRRRGLSQVKLAGLLGRSESWLSQVERGVRRIDRISVLTQIADVLDVPVQQLSPGAIFVSQEAPEMAAVRALREVLIAPAPLTKALAEPRMTCDAGEELERCATVLNEAWGLAHAGQYEELGPRIAEVINRLYALSANANAGQRRRALKMAADGYQIAAALLTKLGAHDAAWIAGDRAVNTGLAVEDPHLAAAGAFRLAHARLAAERPEEARRLAVGVTESLRVPNAPSEQVSLWGAMELVSALANIRLKDEDGALQALRRAESAAAELGEDRNDFHTEFGPTNVALHAVALSVEVGDAGAALRRARTIDASRLSAERQARLLIDVARAHGQRRETDAAVGSLEKAEELTPEQVNGHGLVRDLVRDLLRGERRRTNPELRALARRIGVQP